MTISVIDFDHIVLNVRDVDASADWYERVLGMHRERYKHETGDERVAVRFGRRKINLRPQDASTSDWFTARETAAGGADLCFLTHTAPDQVAAELESLGVAVEVGPTMRQGAQGTLNSVYCRDPDGNLIEISSYAGHPRG